MSPTLDFLQRIDPRYAIAVLCDFDLSATRIVELLHRKNIECTDVMYYHEEENYGAFLRNGGAEEGGIPLLFIFSTDNISLVHSYDDLVAVENLLLV